MLSIQEQDPIISAFRLHHNLTGLKCIVRITKLHSENDAWHLRIRTIIYVGYMWRCPPN